MLLTDVFYYLHNFQLVLDSIENRYADLLNDAETRFIRQFTELPQVSRALLVRMVMRKPRLFLAEHLRYAEICSLAEAMAPLLAARWVADEPALSIDDLFGLFTKPRLTQLLQLSPSDIRLVKSALLDRLRPLFPHKQDLQHWSPTSTTRIFRLDVAAICDRLRLLYFGNFHQSWSEFVLADLGVRRFEPFDVTRTRQFASRQHWDEFETIYRCREMLHHGQDPLLILNLVPDGIDECSWLESRRQRLLFRIGQALERRDQMQAALAIYSVISHPGAAVRAIRIKEAGSDPAGTLSACEAAIAGCPSDLERLLLHRAQHRLRRRLTLTWRPRLSEISTMPPVIDVVLERPDEPYSVECEVGNFLMQQETAAEVYYVENCLMNGLFGLLCWRALFAPVDGAFFHPFHREPADLADRHFFDRRQKLFLDCFAELDDESYRRTILANFELKSGIDNSFVAWAALDIAMLRTALNCIAAHHLKSWFELMAKDFQANCSGFPDLIQLWPQDRRYRLIEVKAPGDRLQDNQRRVLALCADFRIPVAVCRVQWRDSG